jgi:hypothetical protein
VSVCKRKESLQILRNKTHVSNQKSKVTHGLQLFTDSIQRFIKGLHGDLKFPPLPSRHGTIVGIMRNVRISSPRRATNTAASALCAGSHTERRSGGRSRARNPATGDRQIASVADRDGPQGLAVHHYAQSTRQSRAKVDARGAGRRHHPVLFFSCCQHGSHGVEAIA